MVVYAYINMHVHIPMNNKYKQYKYKPLRDVPLRDKTVLLCADLNVPIKDGTILDTFRLEKAMPTITYILSQHVRQLIITSHLGRPTDDERSQFARGQTPIHTLRPVHAWLSHTLPNLSFITDPSRINNAHPVLLENIRLYDQQWLTSMLAIADLAVFDAFAAAHRPPLIPPVRVYAGLLVEEELARPLAFDLVVLGGAKVSDKMQLMRSLTYKEMFVGGGMCLSMLRKRGVGIGMSRYEDVECGDVRGCILPVDFVMRRGSTQGGSGHESGGRNGRNKSDEGNDNDGRNDNDNDNDKGNDNDGQIRVGRDIPHEYTVIDIGPDSIALLQTAIRRSRSIFWNGPLGIFECTDGENGTRALVQCLEEEEKRGKYVLVGGGETACAARRYGQLRNVSTGGGALLRLMEGGDMPGLDVLERY